MTFLDGEQSQVGDSPPIRLIQKGVAHKICSGQVILDLSSSVKELVENSLDAGATCIEINLKEYGEESIKVSDNGCGISPINFKAIALKHHTSKILDFSDLHSLTTFGFRGEALSSLCALSNLSVETRTKNEEVGTHLTFDHSGLVTSERKIARQIGTTVTVEKLFSVYPVRGKEFSRNIRREYGKLISLLNAYAIVAKGVRLICTNSTGRNGKTVVLRSQGSSSLKDNIITIFGLNALSCLEPLQLCVSHNCKVEGFVSKPGSGNGRTSGDRQFFYVNGRPVDMPKVSKMINELYRSSNTRQYPVSILNFILPSEAYDVNVTPDKRKIYFGEETTIIHSLREAIGKIYCPNQCNYSINDPDEPIEELKRGLNDPHIESDKSSHQMSLRNQENRKREDSEWKMLEDNPTHLSKETKEVEENLIVKTEVIMKPTEISPVHQRPLQFSSPEKNIQVKIGADNTKSSIPSSFIQSSLKKFVTVNKRKHEDSCIIISEVPVLRTEIVPCQLRKIDSPCDSSFPKSCNDQCHINCFCETKEVETLGKSRISQRPNENGSIIASCLHNSKEVTYPCEDKIFSAVNKNSKTMHNEKTLEFLSDAPLQTQSSDTSPQFSASSSSLEMCPVLQFNINDLRKRHHRKFEMHSKRFTLGSKTKRCFAAATLEISQSGDQERERCLSAATGELERLFRKEDFARMEVIGQFNLGFIIGKVNEDLFIIDQHAADEIYNFELLSQSTIFNQQPLLKPIQLELSPEEEEVASANLEIIKKNGFTLVENVHAAPGHHYQLKAVPFSRNITFGVNDVKELISVLSDDHGECSIINSYKMDTVDSLCPSRFRSMLASRACRSSIMIGDALGRNEMQKVLHHLSTLRSPWNCPHGRPTMRHLINLAARKPPEVEKYV